MEMRKCDVWKHIDLKNSVRLQQHPTLTYSTSAAPPYFDTYSNVRFSHLAGLLLNMLEDTANV